MVMPPNCSLASTSNPSCPAGTDSGGGGWHWADPTNVDIPDVETTTTDTSATTQLGDAGTANILAYDSAAGFAKYCNDLVLGGYSDWYLPSRSEMTWLVCHSNMGVGGSYPEDAPNCTAMGGKTTALTGFNVNLFYVTTTEYNKDLYWQYYGNSTNAWQTEYKYQTGTNRTLRCIRRY